MVNVDPMKHNQSMKTSRQKGILLAGGSGTRLYPLTQSVSKQLLPIYDKPTIYYPLSTLMLAGVRDVLIISTPRDTPLIERLLGNGAAFGVSLSYKVQEVPKGIPEALVIGREFIGNSPVWLILGDNIFYGNSIKKNLDGARLSGKNCSIFAYRVTNPENFGVVEFNEAGSAVSLEEKPKSPKSNWAVTGLYHYGPGVSEIAERLTPSARGEVEISDLNRIFMEQRQLHVELLGRGYAWLDSGTFDALLSASQFVQTIEKRQGLKIACVEEIAFSQGWIDAVELERRADELKASPYGQYLYQILGMRTGGCLKSYS